MKRTYCKSCSSRRIGEKHTFPSLASVIIFTASPIDSLSKSTTKINSGLHGKLRCELFPYLKIKRDFILQLFSIITLLVGVLVL